MVDVHILKTKKDSKHLFEQCLKSLENEPINIFIEDGIIGDTGLARHLAFQKGDSEYVSYVDPDDLVVPGIFQKCMDAMTEDCAAVYSNENLIDINGTFIRSGEQINQTWSYVKMKNNPKFVHHVVVYKRELVERYSQNIKGFIMHSESLLNTLVSECGAKRFIHLNEVGYYWRLLTKDRKIDYKRELKVKNDIIKQFEMEHSCTFTQHGLQKII